MYCVDIANIYSWGWVAMNIMVTGSGGQLGSEFRAISEGYPQWNFFFFTHQELDITEKEKVQAAMKQCACDVVINCAALTSVDKAEMDPAPAFRVNRDGTETLARCSQEQGAFLIHFSTYNVFNGMSPFPYTENDHPEPHGKNAMAKIAGEDLVRSIASSYMIIRIGWLYSPFGENFVKTMLRLGRERASVRVVSDRIGSPAYSGDLADAVMNILVKKDPEKRYGVTYHYANEGICSWYDLAVAIMKDADLACRVLPIESSEFPVSGPRAWYSALNNHLIKRDWGLEIPHWQTSLAKAIQRMN